MADVELVDKAGLVDRAVLIVDDVLEIVVSLDGTPFSGIGDSSGIES